MVTKTRVPFCGKGRREAERHSCILHHCLLCLAVDCTTVVGYMASDVAPGPTQTSEASVWSTGLMKEQTCNVSDTCAEELLTPDPVIVCWHHHRWISMEQTSGSHLCTPSPAQSRWTFFVNILQSTKKKQNFTSHSTPLPSPPTLKCMGGPSK